MLELIVKFDIWLFRLINEAGANAVFDAVMPFITDFDNFEIPLAIVWVLLMVFGGRKGRMAGVSLAVALLLTDQISSHVIKPLVGRQRPCVTLEDVRLLTGFKNTLSFTSSHAANIFGSATVLSLAYRRLAPAFLLIAAAVAYSRVYIGIHYPLDVICGGVLGIGIGWTVSRWLPAIVERCLKARRRASRSEDDE
jgi:undecaprenyl-diphosphatase